MISLLIPLINLEAEVLSEYVAVNPHALPGDSEFNHLPVQGLRVHEANDYIGDTDKYISGAGSLAVLGIWKHFSTSLSYKGRFLQPALEKRNDQPKLSTPLGIYAEWAEIMLNTSVTIYSKESWGFKLDGGVGYNDLGDHGLVNIYRKIHEIVASPINDKNFGPKLKDHYISSSVGAFVIVPISKTINFMFGHSAYNSKMFVENAVEASLVISASKNFALSMKYMNIKQERSEYYQNLRGHRQQGIVALRLFEFWTPSLMFVSPLLKEDDFSQWYLSPISFTYPF